MSKEYKKLCKKTFHEEYRGKLCMITKNVPSGYKPHVFEYSEEDSSLFPVYTSKETDQSVVSVFQKRIETDKYFLLTGNVVKTTNLAELGPHSRTYLECISTEGVFYIERSFLDVLALNKQEQRALLML